jgi:hypothetical protein
MTKNIQQNSTHMLIGILRNSYGASFARGCADFARGRADKERLSDVLAKDPSLID